MGHGNLSAANGIEMINPPLTAFSNCDPGVTPVTELGGIYKLDTPYDDSGAKEDAAEMFPGPGVTVRPRIPIIGAPSIVPAQVVPVGTNVAFYGATNCYQTGKMTKTNITGYPAGGIGTLNNVILFAMSNSGPGDSGAPIVSNGDSCHQLVAMLLGGDSVKVNGTVTTYGVLLLATLNQFGVKLAGTNTCSNKALLSPAVASASEIPDVDATPTPGSQDGNEDLNIQSVLPQSTIDVKPLSAAKQAEYDEAGVVSNTPEFRSEMESKLQSLGIRWVTYGPDWDAPGYKGQIVIGVGTSDKVTPELTQQFNEDMKGMGGKFPIVLFHENPLIPY